MTRSGEEVRAEAYKVDVGLLPGGIGFLSAGSEPMVKPEGCTLREVRVCLIPERWDFVEEGLWLRYGARKRRLY